MDRLFEANAIGTAPAAPSPGSTGYPTDGAPFTQAPTVPGEHWFYMITEEIRKVITDAGLTPSATALQLSTAINSLMASAAGSQRFENVALLSGSTALIDGQLCSTVGYYSTAVQITPDGGGNIYVYRATSTATVDGGLVLNSASGGRLHALNQTTTNILQYGADKTGTNFSDSAFNAASKNGAYIYVPAGIFKLSSASAISLVNAGGFIGAGPGATILQIVDSGTFDFISIGPDTATTYTYSACMVAHLTIDATLQGDGRVFNFTKAREPIIENVAVIGGPALLKMVQTTLGRATRIFTKMMRGTTQDANGIPYLIFMDGRTVNGNAFKADNIQLNADPTRRPNGILADGDTGTLVIDTGGSLNVHNALLLRNSANAAQAPAYWRVIDFGTDYGTGCYALVEAAIDLEITVPYIHGDGTNSAADGILLDDRQDMVLPLLATGSSSSPSLTAVSPLNIVTAGMTVFAVNALPQGNPVLGIIDQHTIEITTPATTTSTGVSLTIGDLTTTGDLNSTTTISNIPDTSTINIGDNVSGTGIPQSPTTTVSSVDTGAGTVTFSQDSLVTNPACYVSFFQSTTATWSANSNTIVVASATGISKGQLCFAVGIASGSLVTDIAGTTITLSKPTVAAGSGAAVQFKIELICNVTAANAVASAFVGTDKLSAGMGVAGTNIPGGATLLSVDSATGITLSVNPTGAVSSITVTGYDTNGIHDVGIKGSRIKGYGFCGVRNEACETLTVDISVEGCSRFLTSGFSGIVAGPHSINTQIKAARSGHEKVGGTFFQAYGLEVQSGAQTVSSIATDMTSNAVAPYIDQTNGAEFNCVPVGGTQGNDIQLKTSPTKTAGFVAMSGFVYPVDTTGGTIVMQAPANPRNGDQFGYSDATGEFPTNHLSVGWNGNLYRGASTALSDATAYGFAMFKFNAAAGQWSKISGNPST